MLEFFLPKFRTNTADIYSITRMGYHFRWKIGGKWAENRRNSAYSVLPGMFLCTFVLATREMANGIALNARQHFDYMLIAYSGQASLAWWKRRSSPIWGDHEFSTSCCFTKRQQFREPHGPDALLARHSWLSARRHGETAVYQLKQSKFNAIHVFETENTSWKIEWKKIDR